MVLKHSKCWLHQSYMRNEPQEDVKHSRWYLLRYMLLGLMVLWPFSCCCLWQSVTSDATLPGREEYSLLLSLHAFSTNCEWGRWSSFLVLFPCLMYCMCFVCGRLESVYFCMYACQYWCCLFRNTAQDILGVCMLSASYVIDMTKSSTVSSPFLCHRYDKIQRCLFF